MFYQPDLAQHQNRHFSFRSDQITELDVISRVALTEDKKAIKQRELYSVSKCTLYFKTHMSFRRTR